MFGSLCRRKLYIILNINSDMVVIKCLFWASVLTFLLEINVIMTASSMSYESAYACDGKMLKIECSEDSVINLIRANYGRYSIVICNDQSNTTWNVNCMSHTSFPILRTHCQQKRNCSIRADASLFDDACPETVKYLEAHYICIKHHPTAVQTTSESQPISTSTDNNNNSSRLLNDEKGPVCEPKNVRNLFWNYTNGGDISIQSCPDGASGFARWRCQAISENVAVRSPDAPDLSDCKSVRLVSLNNRIMDGEAIMKIASDLSQLTDSSKTLYGGDISISCKLIEDMVQKMSKDILVFPDPRQREAVVFDLLRSVVQIGSHLLDSNTLASWHDLPYREQMQLASSLLVNLEETSFLLANTLSKERTITHCEKNIVLQVQILQTQDVVDKTFPMSLSTECRIKSSSYVQFLKTSLLENSELGMVRVLYIVFDSLENILRATPSSVGKDEKRINSKVLLVSFGRSNIQLNQPVTLSFEHLQTENVSNVSCVHWDHMQNMWSEEGCMLVSTNETHTTCQCNHLGNFAVLVDT